jgi:hypothetical protein
MGNVGDPPAIRMGTPVPLRIKSSFIVRTVANALRCPDVRQHAFRIDDERGRIDVVDILNAIPGVIGLLHRAGTLKS